MRNKVSSRQVSIAFPFYFEGLCFFLMLLSGCAENSQQFERRSWGVYGVDAYQSVAALERVRDSLHDDQEELVKVVTTMTAARDEAQQSARSFSKIRR